MDNTDGSLVPPNSSESVVADPPFSEQRMPGNFFEFTWHSRGNGTANAIAKVRPGNKYAAVLEAEIVSVMSIRFLRNDERRDDAMKSIWLPKSEKISQVYTAVRTVTLDDRLLKRTKKFQCEFYFVDDFVEEFGIAAIIIGSADIHNAFVTHNDPQGSYYVLEE